MPEEKERGFGTLKSTESVVGEPLSASVEVGQEYTYQGPTSQHLANGERFQVKEVSDDRGVVKIVGAREAAQASRETRDPMTFLVPKDKWERLPKQLEVESPKE